METEPSSQQTQNRRNGHGNVISSPKKPKQRQLSVPYYKLFCFADGLDYLLMTVGGISALAHGICLPVFLVVFGKLIDALGNVALQSEDVMAKQVSKYALYFVYLGVVRLVTGWIDISLWMYTGDRQSTKMRIEYVKALISQEVGFFDTDVSTGEAVVGISSDTALIQDAVGMKTGTVMQFLAQFLSGYAIAFASVWKLTLMTLAVMPLLAGTAALCAYIMVGLSSRSQKAYVSAGETAQEVIGQIRTVQAFVGETKASQAYSASLTECRAIGRRSGLAKGISIGLIYSLGFATFALLLWYAGKLIRQGDVSGGIAFTTIMNVLSSTLALGQAAPSIGTITKAKVSGYTVLEVINRKPKIASSPGEGIRLDKVDGTIEFREVTFSYPSRPDIDVLQSLSLMISAGKAIAIVGGSGSGKSTVISLIQRFYDPTSGEILLDGRNIQSMQLKWLRDQMGLVSQEPALFATTIRENIMYGKDGDVSLDEIAKAAMVSCAHDFISALPKSYETEVGERGTQLSGGQKQRIAIARAILKNPSILLLDEATSALDSESEKGVQEALDKVMVGRTTVVVAHRLSTIQNADMIAVLQHGQVAEIGTHAELLENGGVYASLVKAQEKAPASSLGNKLDSRTLHGSLRGSISRRGSFNGSVSQKTFSFRSNAESVISVGDKMNDVGLGVDDVRVGPKPSLRRLLKMNASEWPYGLISAVAAVVAGSQTPVFALVITLALEYFYSFDPEQMISGLKRVSMLCCVSGMIVLIAYMCEFYFAEVAGENITMRIRSMMFSAILKNEISWFDQNNSMVLASRLANDAPLVRSSVVDRNITLLQNMGLMVTALVITIKLNWKVALVTMSTFPFLILAYGGQMQFIKGFSGDLDKAYLRANMVAGEAVSNIRTVAAFSAEDKVMKLFSKQLERSQKKSFVRGQIGGIFYGFSQFVLPTSYGFALWYSSGLIRKGEADFGQVMKCFMVLIITSFGVAEALSLAPDILRGTETLRAVFGILDRQTEIDVDDAKAEEVSNVKGNVEFKHVDFYYPTRVDVQVFKDFNLRIRAGHSLAMVGSSGSGKSSVIALIIRYYDPQTGRVLIDGKDIRHYKLKSLRQHIGLVQQEPALFSTSIYENISYGKDGATEAEIIEAAKAANAHSFISSLPEGYKTNVGERGVQLSGGQKQRVAIARAVLRNPAILLLDEATSALDAQSEKLVQEALDRLMQGRTTVLVAHRLSTIKNAKSIAVLQDGSIVEQGTHTELLAKKGAYFNLQSLAHKQEDGLN